MVLPAGCALIRPRGKNMKHLRLLFFLLLLSCSKSVNTLDPSQSVFFAESPRLTISYAASLDYSIRLNGPAILHYVTVPAGSPEPSPQEILQGKAAGGLNPAASASFDTEIFPETGGAVVPQTNTPYDVYMTAEPKYGLKGLLTCVHNVSGTSASAYASKTNWGSTGAGNGQFNNPVGIALSPDGKYIYVSDNGNNRIQKFDRNGNFILSWGSYGTADGQFDGPHFIAVDAAGCVYVSQNGTSYERVQKFDKNGNFIASYGTNGTGGGQFGSPDGICFDPEGNIYVADWGNNRVQKFDKNGNFIAVCVTGGSGNGQIGGPVGICRDSTGHFYVVEMNNSRVQKFDSNWNYVAIWGITGSYGSADNQFANPMGICVDAADNVYVADGDNRRIKKYDTNGNLLCIIGNTEINNVQQICVDALGYVYTPGYADNMVHIYR